MSAPTYRRGTYCPQVDQAFADGVARVIADAVTHWQPEKLVLRGYTPPYEPGEFPEGYIELSFVRNDQTTDRSIGIEFGQTDTLGRDFREPFDVASWLTDPADPMSAPITAINFDEAWRIICRVAERLSLSTVSVVYGC